MSSRDQPLSSNNPFRRKLGYPTFSTEGDVPAPVPASSFEKPFDPIPPTSFATFKSTPPEDEAREGRSKDTTPVQPKPKKVVKKVRVQSPPPSSPEDTGPVSRFPSVSDDEDDSDEDHDDGYNSDHSDLPEYGDQIDLDTDSFAIKDRDGSGLGRLGSPANPFAKTLEDLEQSGQGQNAKSLTKGALDVDSFKRLLLTGHANFPGRPSASAPELGGDLRVQSSSLHGRETSTDARPRSRQSIFDTVPPKETSQISQPITGAEDSGEKRGALLPSPFSSAPLSSMKKKPPPPSSRHGKLIKIELGAGIESHTTRSPTPPISTNLTTIPPFDPSRKSNPQANTPLQSPLLPTDVNKPLPLTPFRPSVEEAVDSPFDREAIGKVPEPFTDLRANPEPPMPPLASQPHSESNGITQSRKPAAPPPRRHGRSDSRAPSINTTNADEDTPPRSSIESNRSRTDSLRTNTNMANNPNVPAPPPPRRPNHARHGSSFKSPSQANSTPVSATASTENERNVMGTSLGSVSKSGQIEAQGSPATIITNKDGISKLSPPPPPPTRQASTRRPPSVKSVDLGNGSNTTRRVSREKDGGVPPPPPPPRQRGSSRASVENPAVLAESTGNTSGDTQKEATITQANAEAVAVADTKQGAEILADLDALQREVDALMGRYGKSGGS
ncbi:uncharacterized protein F4812DRAFT_462155 [Daldinia caldariorum]|uniref:uncharacterized protein n=1 Tax=Daldinia caldariorum TaxID=326644 RepID=UPI0020077AC9|nr:uncharacterized protein F4812DRAFT_462155 [Daldinia caldariorum]KAI1464829.1 hypothetical protein F4812DRAFT_462155 [Daldinia caldariorum]